MSETNVAKDLAAGTMAGVSQIVVGHPFDTIKVKMQSGGASSGGAMDALRHTVRTEGARAGLFRGMGAPLASVAAVNALLFTVRGKAESILEHEDGSPLNTWDHLRIGAVSGAAVSVVSCPTELIKCRLQAQGQASNSTVFDAGSKRMHGRFENQSKHFAEKEASRMQSSKYAGPLDVIRRTGIVGLYRGYGITLLREVPGTALMLASYAHALNGLEAKGGAWERSAPLLAGAWGGAIYWSVTYPVDLVKSIQQTDTGPRNAWTWFLKVYEREGIRSFYRGFSPCLVRSLPANGATFLTYEYVRKRLDSIP